MKFVSDFYRKTDACGNRYLSIYLQGRGSWWLILAMTFPSLETDADASHFRIPLSPPLCFFSLTSFSEISWFNTFDIRPLFFSSRIWMLLVLMQETFFCHNFHKSSLGQEESSAYIRNTNILSKDHTGSWENKVLSKLKEVETELKSLKENYNYYMNLTERMANRMEEIKHNMSSLLERHFRPVKQVEEKFLNQHDDQTG